MKRSRAGAIVGAVLLAGLAVDVVSAQALATHPGNASGVSAASSSPEAEAQAATRAENRRLLSLVRLPASSVRDKGPQVAGLRQPAQRAGTTDLVDQSEFFTLPLSVSAAGGYLKAHGTHDLAFMGGGRLCCGKDSYADLVFSDSKSSSRYAEPELLYTFAATGTKTALRVDAQTIVVHPHTMAEQIGPGAGAATISAAHGFPAKVVKTATLNRQQTHALAVALNSAQTAGNGARSCLSDNGSRLSVSFATSSQTFVVDPACYLISATVNGGAQPSYNLSQKVEKLLLEDVGLTEKEFFGS